MADLDLETRLDVVGFLKVAHEYAITGSIIPLRAACLALKLKEDSQVYQVARGMIYDELKSRGNKPSAEEYKEAILRALERIEATL